MGRVIPMAGGTSTCFSVANVEVGESSFHAVIHQLPRARPPRRPLCAPHSRRGPTPLETALWVGRSKLVRRKEAVGARHGAVGALSPMPHPPPLTPTPLDRAAGAPPGLLPALGEWHRLAEWVKVVSSGVLAPVLQPPRPAPGSTLSLRVLSQPQAQGLICWAPEAGERVPWAARPSVQPQLGRKKRGVPPESGDTYSDPILPGPGGGPLAGAGLTAAASTGGLRPGVPPLRAEPSSARRPRELGHGRRLEAAVAAGAGRVGSGKCGRRSRALNSAQEVSAISKELLAANPGPEGLLVRGLGLVPASRGSKSIWSKNL